MYTQTINVGHLLRAEDNAAAPRAVLPGAALDGGRVGRAEGHRPRVGMLPAARNNKQRGQLQSCCLPVAAAAVEASLMTAEVGEVEGLAAREAAADQSEVSMRSRDRGSTNHSSPEAVSVEHPGLHLHLLRLEHLAAAPRTAATLEVISQTSSYV